MANSEYKAGQLYVDFEGRGLQSMAHGLQVAKMGFNAVKGAANKAMREVVGFLDENSKAALKFQKMSTLTGLPFGDLKKLDAWSRRIGVDMSMVSSSIIKTQQDLLNFAMGKGGNAEVWNILGINPKDFNVNDPLEVFTKLGESFKGLNAASKTWVATQLGFSGEMIYALEHYDTLVNKNLLLTQDEIRKQEELNDKWLETQFTVEQTTEKIKTNILYNVLPFLKEFDKWILTINQDFARTGSVIETVGIQVGSALKNMMSSFFGGGFDNLGKWFKAVGVALSSIQQAATQGSVSDRIKNTIAALIGSGIGLTEAAKELMKPVGAEANFRKGVRSGLSGVSTGLTRDAKTPTGQMVSPTEQVRATGQSMRPQTFESMRGGYKRDESGRIIDGIPTAPPTNQSDSAIPPANAPSVTPTVGNGGIIEVNINLSQNVGSGDPMAIKDATLMALSTARDEINNYYERSISIV